MEGNFLEKKKITLQKKIGKRRLAADFPFPFVHQFRFYHTTSHYLCHEMSYHSRLVEIA